MQVTETTNEGLKREIEVVIAASALEEKLNSKLKEIQPKAQIKGFRPGKVPITHLKKIHGKSIMAEIIQEDIARDSEKIIKDRNEVAAYQPQINLPEDQAEIEKIIACQQDMKYSLVYEVQPDFDIMDFSKITLERKIVKVGDDEISSSLQTIAEQNRTFEVVKRKAKSGDVVVIDFVGKKDGKEFDNGAGKDMPLELGSNSFVPGFEDQLIGTKAGDEKTIALKMPEDYVEDLAGADVTFDVKIGEVKEPKTPKIDLDLAKQLGFDSLDKLKEKVKEQLENQFSQVCRQLMKRELFDKLDKHYDFELPPTLIEQEFNQIWQQVSTEMAQKGEKYDDDKEEEAAKMEYKDIAKRRVKLGLVLSKVGDDKEIKVSDEEVSQEITKKMQQYPGQEQQIVDFYKNNPQALAQVRAPIFEEKVADYIIELTKKEEFTISKEELIKLEQAEDDEGDNKVKPKKGAKPKAAAKKTTAKKPAAKKSNEKPIKK